MTWNDIPSTQREIDNLHTLLKQLEISPIITSIANMRETQHALYEESINGIDLGYCFGDYPSGKFSPELRDVQIDLNNSLITDDY